MRPPTGQCLVLWCAECQRQMLQKSRELRPGAQAAVTMTAAVDLSARLAEILADPSFEPELLARALAHIDDTPRTLAESDERLERRKQRRADMGIAPAKRPPLKMPPRLTGSTAWRLGHHADIRLWWTVRASPRCCPAGSVSRTESGECS